MHLREESEKAVRLLSFLNHLNNGKWMWLSAEKDRPIIDFVEYIESTNVLSKAVDQVSSLQIAAKQFVFDTMFVYIRDKLLTVPSLEGWRVELPDAQSVPQFSLSAQVSNQPHCRIRNTNLLFVNYTVARLLMTLLPIL
jgi:hypothetical protein